MRSWAGVAGPEAGLFLLPGTGEKEGDVGLGLKLRAP